MLNVDFFRFDCNTMHMHEEFIFAVGRPDLGAQSVERIHSLGYKAGLFADSSRHIAHQNTYDLVIPFDFSDTEQSIGTIPGGISIAGLICTYENYVPAKATIGERLGIPSLSVESAQLCTDKTLMRDAFNAYDPTLSPQYRQVQTLEDARQFTRSFGYPVIIKPAGLVKSLLVMRCDKDDELKNNVEVALGSIDKLYQKYGVFGREPKLLIEQFITGQMYSIAGFVDKDGHLFCCDDVVELTTAQQCGVDDNYLYRRTLPSGANDALKQQLLRVATQGVRALKVSHSPAHIELIVSNDGSAKIIEIGARIGGYRPRMYDMSYGVDLLRAEIQTAIGTTPNINGNFRAYTAVYELFPIAKGALKTDVSDDIANNFAYFSQKPKPGDEIGPSRDGYKATAVIIVSESDRESFAKKCRLAESLSVEIV